MPAYIEECLYMIDVYGVELLTYLKEHNYDTAYLCEILGQCEPTSGTTTPAYELFMKK